jgi:hypothetical protein
MYKQRSQYGDRRDSTLMLDSRHDSRQTIEMHTLSSPPKDSRHGSTQSLDEKPLPSPNLWGQVSMGARRVQYDARRRIWLFRYFGTGWRTTVGAGAGVAISTLFINIILLGWGSSKPWDPFTHTRTLSEGDCRQMQYVFTYSHLVINVISTILLGTSNAAMQCLSAPTRDAVRLRCFARVLFLWAYVFETNTLNRLTGRMPQANGSILESRAFAIGRTWTLGANGAGSCCYSPRYHYIYCK